MRHVVLHLHADSSAHGRRMPQGADPRRLEAAAAAAPSLVAEISTGRYAPVGALLAGRGAGDVVHTACALAALLRPAAASPIVLATA